jgi:hypothetical protein
VGWRRTTPLILIVVFNAITAVAVDAIAKFEQRWWGWSRTCWRFATAISTRFVMIFFNSWSRISSPF